MNFYEFDNKKEKIEHEPRDQDAERNGEREKLNKENKEEKDNSKANNINMEEGFEKELEGQLGDEAVSNNKLAETIEKKIEFNMKNAKKEVRLKVEDKINMEKIRRWDVKIFSIYITPLREMLDPFIQFTIGGDYSVQVFKNKKGDTFKVPGGSRGFSDKTEVLKNVDALAREPFEAVIQTEVRMSYSMINNQKMMVELWDYNSIWMNTILGYSTINLIDIVNGNMSQTVDIKKKMKKKKRAQIQATIEFKCVFQEIWDYKISILNWKLENVLSQRQQKDSSTTIPNLQLIVEFENRNVTQSYSISKSKIIEKCANPTFSAFDQCLMFRGTSQDLENQYLLVKLIDHQNIFSKTLSYKSINLQGILEFERIKNDFAMVDPVSKDKYNVLMEGSLKIDHNTKYCQKGDSANLVSTKKYLCINIQRVENIRPAETRGIVDSFISCEYTGLSLRTKTIKENNNPNFNEVLYFTVPIKEEYLKEIEKYTQKINEEFANKNEVTFNLMCEGDNNTYDNLGIGFFHLSDLKMGGAHTTKRYYADDLKKMGL